MHHKESRATLGGKLSAVLVAAGSSVGLGNIWRFPYVAGDNGGGAFLIIYILCVLLLGLPLMIAEFTVGRASHRNAVGAYRALNPRWSFLGYNGVLAAFLILGFYFVVSGWTAEYMVHSVTGSIARFSTAEQYKSLFENFISNPWRPVVYTCLFVLATHFVIAMGVQKDGTLNGISILSISETAGLGMKADTDDFKNQFRDKKVEKFQYTKTGAASEDEIDAISGATITTNAVTNGVNAGLAAFQYMEGGEQ